MKNLIILTVLSIFSVIVHAQNTVTVTGQVTDDAGNIVPNASGAIYWSDCGTILDFPFSSDSLGMYEYSFVSTCPGDSLIEVIFYCPSDPSMSGQAVGVFDIASGITNIQLDVTNVCQTSTSLPCEVSLTGVQDTITNAGETYWTFVAAVQGGTAPYTYSWDFGAGSPLNTFESDVMTAYYQQSGTYLTCVNVTSADGTTCNSCFTFVVQNPNTGCITSIGQYTSPSGGVILEATTQGTSTNYQYEWTTANGTIYVGNSFDMSNYPDGTYTACVAAIGDNGDVCDDCTVVTINNNTNPQDTCVMNMTYIPGDFAPWWTFVADAGVLPANTTYQWVLPNGASLVDPSQANSTQVDIEFTNAGTYTICANVIDLTTGDILCGECITATYPNNGSGGQCWTSFQTTEFTGYTEHIASTQGGTAPYTYEWYMNNTFLSSGVVLQFTPSTDSFELCLVTTDANGITCSYCEIIDLTAPPVDECLDWNVIDLANAPCTFDWDPVCGCDGITYENACIAYYCFGVIDWTPGECDYSGGGTGTGGNTGGNPTDTLCQTTAEFFYFGGLSANGDFEVNLFGNGINADEFIWTFSNGTSATGAEQTVYYSSVDSLQAYTICLTTVSWGDSCTATVCETIVLDETPNGTVSGQVTEGSNAWGGNEVVLKNSAAPGDPVAGLLIELEDVNGNMIASTTTDANGNYSFNGVPFGDYFVHVNVAGVPHTPYMITLEPRIQGRPDLNFEVNSNAVVSNENLVSFASDVLLSPNPTTDFVNLSMSISETIEANVLVTDVLGRTVQTRAIQLNQGREVVRVDLDGLSAGMYMISLQANGETLTKKVLKK